MTRVAQLLDFCRVGCESDSDLDVGHGESAFCLSFGLGKGGKHPVYVGFGFGPFVYSDCTKLVLAIDKSFDIDTR